jgi:hypothetical protein
MSQISIADSVGLPGAADDWLIALAAATVAVGVICGAVLGVLRLVRKALRWSRRLEKLMAQVNTVDVRTRQQLLPNGGDSLADQVLAIHKELTEHIASATRKDQKINGDLQRIQRWVGMHPLRDQDD